jgi:TetR/AcrR family transcriptional regulator, transcriptional repressor for nem operon
MANSSAATVAAILDAAERITQLVGFNGLSFRDVAKVVGIKSASVHYHFPSKAQLGVALVRRYTDRLVGQLQSIDNRKIDPKDAFALYVGGMRATLRQDGKMCLGGILAAEIDAVPGEVRIEVRRFVDLNVHWLAQQLGLATGVPTTGEVMTQHARAVFAALQGAMLIARGTGDIAGFDAMTQQFMRTGLVPA